MVTLSRFVVRETLTLMKNLIIIATVLLPLIASAQIEKGRSFTTGRLSYQLTSSPAVKVNIFTVGADYGYLFSNKWAGGLNVSYSYNKQNLPNNLEDYSKAYSVGIFARRYFSFTDKLYFTLDGGAGVAYQDSRMESNPALPIGARSTELRFSVSPGLTYFLTRRFALQANLGQVSFRAPFNETARNLYIETSLSKLSVGLSIYLGK